MVVSAQPPKVLIFSQGTGDEPTGVVHDPDDLDRRTKGGVKNWIPSMNPPLGLVHGLWGKVWGGGPGF